MEKVIGIISHKIDFLHTNLIVVVGFLWQSITRLFNTHMRK